MNWIKWHHDGVPDKEGENRESVRKDLALLRHCEPCTALSGCCFVMDKKPDYPQHPFCDCLLLPIVISYGELIAYCDIRKFTEYIFQFNNSHGKSYLFEEWGFNIGDSENLKEEFERQAKQKYANGDYNLHYADRNGQRITITITLQSQNKNDIIIKTGWMVHPLGLIACVTPFTGVVK